MSRLVVLTGPLRGQAFDLTSQRGKLVRIGRSRQDTDIVLPDPAVSRRHAELMFRDGQWILRDVGSANGTFVDELRLQAPTPLPDQCHIRCGATVLLYEHSHSMSPSAGAAQTVELAFDPGETVVAVAVNSRRRPAVDLHQRIYQAGQAALTISHGVKNLLQAVQSALELLGGALNSGQLETAKKHYHLLARNLQKIQKTILDMLKFSKPSQPHFQMCWINRLIETTVSLVWPQAQQRQVSITTQLDQTLEQVQADPDLMQDAVLNLLLNALDAVPTQTGQIVVSTLRLDQQDGWQLKVADNGKGIADTSVIFEPFFTDKAGFGAGLGLAIVRQIVQAHQGTIDVQSSPGSGAIFTLTFPNNPAAAKPKGLA